MSGQPVLMDQDGGGDDFLAAALLLTMDHVETIGIVVTPGDCYIEPAVSVTRKLLDLMDRPDIPVAKSTVRGLNPFPGAWRSLSFAVDHLPVLNDSDTIRTPLVPESGQAFMARVLREAPEPVTVLETGPLTTVAAALEIAPDIEGKIKEIVWMGGALNVPGNVAEPGHDGSAEWNVYWDPFAARRIWETSIPIVLCPLDITNRVPVTTELVRQLGRQRRYPLSDFAAHCYAMVVKESYFFWDVLTAAYVGRPDLFTLREWETVIVTEGPGQGRTRVEPGGRKIMAMDQVDIEAFYAYILEQWAR
ncbi:MAG TPA: nucleoside hydrolase [Chloroflexi bacterium]|nr:nucleoside hydrolase [Chloroflexota bacterium]